jgi:hypothetical protein
LSAIIGCRFHLDLHRRNAHPNTNTSQDIPTLSLGSFHAATQSLHDAVMAEFGNSHTGDGDVLREVVVPADLEMPAAAMGDNIEPVESPSLPQEAESSLEA